MMKNELNSRLNVLKDNRGWSIMEIIIVLVLIAVIAAFMIPTMLGFVHEAEGKAYIANARTCYIAAQVIATEESAKGTSDATISAKIKADDARFSALVGPEVIEDATISGTVTNGQVTQIVYTRDGHTVTLNPGGTTDIS